jgi:hypothetical protein
MRHKRGFARVDATRQWQAQQAAKRARPVTPEDYGWLPYPDGEYYLEGVDDVHLETWAGFGYLLVYHDLGNRKVHVAPGLLGRMTEFILEDNGLCEAAKTETSKP